VILIDALEATAAHLAGSLPVVMSSFGFECRLQRRTTTVDLGLCVEPSNGGRGALAGLGAAGGQPTTDDRWHRISALAARWADATSPLHAWVPFLFLEFDADYALDGVPVPAVFVSFDWPLAEPPTANAPSPGAGCVTLRVAQEALYVLRGASPQPIDANLESCFRELPSDGRAVHVGAMLGRPGTAVRLSVSMPAGELRDYLTRVGWPSSAGVDALLGTFAPSAGRVHAEFDVGEVIGPQLGLVLSPSDSGDDAGRWHGLLARLVENALCTPAKRAALLKWPAVTREAPIGVGRCCFLQRAVSHIKVSSGPLRRPEAKAYLTVTPRIPRVTE
jgi:hypothetical protein